MNKEEFANDCRMHAQEAAKLYAKWSKSDRQWTAWFLVYILITAFLSLLSAIMGTWIGQGIQAGLSILGMLQLRDHLKEAKTTGGFLKSRQAFLDMAKDAEKEL
jgi:hypothetical protein